MEIQTSDNTTLISTDKTMLSISIARQSEEVVKCFIFSDLKINVNVLGDHLEKTKMVDCLHTDSVKGFILLHKTEIYNQLGVQKACVQFIKSLENEN